MCVQRGVLCARFLAALTTAITPSFICSSQRRGGGAGMKVKVINRSEEQCTRTRSQDVVKVSRTKAA